MPTRLPDDAKPDALPVSGPTRLSADAKPDTPETKDPSTTLGGLANAATRGLAPTAVGGAIGFGLGGPPGALLGAGAMGGTEFVLNIYNSVANATGLPRSYTPQDATDKLISLLGGKPREEMSGAEQMVESTLGGAAGGYGQAAGAARLAEKASGPVTKKVLETVADKPLAQAVGGALGGAGSQATQEMGFTDPFTPMVGGALATATGGALAQGLSRPIGRVSQGFGITPPQFVGERQTRKANKTENAARESISSRFNQGVKGGAPTAVDVMEKMNAAREEGQPYRLLDAENRPLQGLAGKTYREGGTPQQEIGGFLDERNKAQRGRVKGLIGKYFSNQSAMETADELETLRSSTGKALWNAAFDGGSLAPLEKQYQSAWVKAGQDEREAFQRLSQAQQRATIAASKKATASNVYSTSGANSEMRGAMLELREAQDALKTAQMDKQASLDKLQTAQIDRQTNAPGGIWSPYLDRLFQQPEIKRGINRGIGIERRDAVGRNTVFNPTEYALDEKGNVLSVPNMRTWSVAKKGLDAIISSPAMRDPLTGRLTETGVSYKVLRDGLVNELDRLNPAYAEARQHWGEYTASRRAVANGQNALQESKFSPEELKAHFHDLEEGDKQFFLLGLADALRKKLRHTGETADKAKIINEDARERLQGIFGDDAQASRFMDAIERESQMKQTRFNVVGGSQSAERLAEDDRPSWQSLLGAGSDTLRAAFHTAHGSWPLALSSGFRAARHLMRDRPDMPQNEAVSRLLLSPDIDALVSRGQAARGEGSQLFPLLNLPPTLPRRLMPGSVAGSVNAQHNTSEANQ